MEWLQYLLLLICPLMMIFCMKGHNHSHGKGNGDHCEDHQTHGSKELDIKLSRLETENEKLRKEINALSAMVKKES